MTAVGKGEEAARLYGQSLDIARRLAEAEPDRADYQHDLVLALQRLGQTQREASPQVAFEAWREAYELAARLADQEPDRPDVAVDVALCLYLLSEFVEDPAPLIQHARQVLEGHGDRLPENGHRLLALLSGEDTES